jgi:hypothetical protein
MAQGLHREIYDDVLPYGLGQVEGMMGIQDESAFLGLLAFLGTHWSTTVDLYRWQILLIYAEAHRTFREGQTASASAGGVGFYGTAYPDTPVHARKGYLPPDPCGAGLWPRLKGLIQGIVSTCSDAFLQQLGHIEPHIISQGHIPTPRQTAIIAVGHLGVKEREGCLLRFSHTIVSPFVQEAGLFSNSSTDIQI